MSPERPILSDIPLPSGGPPPSDGELLGRAVAEIEQHQAAIERVRELAEKLIDEAPSMVNAPESGVTAGEVWEGEHTAWIARRFLAALDGTDGTS